MEVKISEHLNYPKIFRLVIFPIVMMVFISLYSIVDGIFIANFANTSSFAAVNLVFPIPMIIGSIGFMMGTGGTALVSQTLGQQRREDANSYFSLIIYFTMILGAVVSVVIFFFMEGIVNLMARFTNGTTEEMVREAILYGKILSLGQVLFMLQNLFQSFFMVAEKPRLGFRFTLMGGITNMIIDALFIGLFRWGIVGAASATLCGYLVAGLGSLIYFLTHKNLNISLGKAKFRIKPLLRTMYNGMSEFISNISMNVVAIIFNIELLKVYGENGVSAYGIIMYVSFVFVAIFIGYSIGVAPAIGYQYGAENKKELHNIFVKSLIILLATSFVMFVVSELTARPFSKIFANSNVDLEELSTIAMRFSAITFLMAGVNIFTSSFFTSLGNGTISAISSILRTVIFQIGSVFIIPLLIKENGIWISIVVAEVLTTIVSVTLLLSHRKRYGY